MTPMLTVCRLLALTVPPTMSIVPVAGVAIRFDVSTPQSLLMSCLLVSCLCPSHRSPTSASLASRFLLCHCLWLYCIRPVAVESRSRSFPVARSAALWHPERGHSNEAAGRALPHPVKGFP